MVINKKIKVFEAFAGIGTQRMALKNLGIPHDVVAISEIDKYAIKSYEEIHGETLNLGDISKIEIENVPDHDLFTYSFPCQDISTAGHGKGLEKGSGSRSSLLWECERIIEGKKPKFLLMENVKNLVGKKFKDDFEKWLNTLEELGYTNYWKVLNAKDYGIPQNRERVFCISILNDTQGYKFPDPIELDIRLKDLLEDEVDEKFYLSQEQIDRITFSTFQSANRRIQEKDYCDTLLARDFKDPKYVKVEQIGQYNTPTRQNSNRFRVYDDESISPSLTTMGGGNLEPHVVDKKVFEQRTDEGARFFKGDYVGTIRAKESGGDKRVLIKNNTKQGYLEAENGDGIDLAFINSNTRRGRVQKGISQTLDTGSEKGVLITANKDYQNKDNYTIIGSTQKHAAINNVGVCPTLTSAMGSGGGHVPMHDYDFRIRKLTPKECWRLMGISDDDFHKAEKINSNTQLYKQAGNAIVVNVLEAIFGNLFINNHG